MTSYDTNLEQIEQVAFPEFYDITYGATTERYTSWNKDTIFQGVEYKAVSIKRSSFHFDIKMSAVTVNVAAPTLNSFARFIANQPIEPTTIKIYRAVEDDLTDYELLFTGEVLTVSHSGQVATGNCVSTSGNLDVTFPRIVHQSFCNWMLFDTQCTLNNTAYIIQATITDISGADYTAVEFGAEASGYITGGWVEFENDMRFITLHSGSVLSLQLPFDSRVIVGSSVDVYPGCDGNPETCRNTFNNFDNFLGFPYIPSTNPVIWGLK